MFGWDTQDVAAVATFGLLIVTSIYAFHTWRMAKHARTSATASSEAAKAAAAAAEATKRATSIAEAALDIRFLVEYVEEDEDMSVNRWLTVECPGTNVYIHGLVIHGVMHPSGTNEMRLLSGPVEVMDRDALPSLLHRGEKIVFDWPAPRINRQLTNAAVAHVRYSIVPTDPPREVIGAVRFPPKPVQPGEYL